MATVKRLQHNRGQLILLGGLTLAVLLVGLAVILNAAIYTENVASRGDTTEAETAMEFQGEAQVGVEGIIESINADSKNYSTYDDLEAAFDGSLGAWSAIVSRYHAANGAVTEVTAGMSIEGTRIVQDTESGFQDANGNTDWSLTAGVPENGSRNVELRVNTITGSLYSDPNLLDGTVTTADYLTSESFRMTFDDGTTEWTVYVYGDGGLSDRAYVTVVEDPSPLLGLVGDEKILGQRCSAPGGPDDHVTIDLTGAKVGGTNCEALKFFDDLSGSYDIRYENTKTLLGQDTIRGTYSLVVKQTESTVESVSSPTPYYPEDTTNESPYADQAIYAHDINVVYQGPRIYYAVDGLRVVPGGTR